MNANNPFKPHQDLHGAKNRRLEDSDKKMRIQLRELIHWGYSVKGIAEGFNRDSRYAAVLLMQKRVKDGTLDPFLFAMEEVKLIKWYGGAEEFETFDITPAELKRIVAPCDAPETDDIDKTIEYVMREFIEEDED